MCPKSYALGRWRGIGRLPWDVRLALDICPDSYIVGYDRGRDDPERRAPRAKPPRR